MYKRLTTKEIEDIFDSINLPNYKRNKVLEYVNKHCNDEDAYVYSSSNYDYNFSSTTYIAIKILSKLNNFDNINFIDTPYYDVNNKRTTMMDDYKLNFSINNDLDDCIVNESVKILNNIIEKNIVYIYKLCYCYQHDNIMNVVHRLYSKSIF